MWERIDRDRGTHIFIALVQQEDSKGTVQTVLLEEYCIRTGFNLIEEDG